MEEDLEPPETAPLVPRRPGEAQHPKSVKQYGATHDDASSGTMAGGEGGGDADVETNKVPLKEGEKVFKEFREIAFLCIGLWTAVFCSALSGTVVSNLQIEIASYFKSASLSAWIGSAYLLGLASFTPLWGRICEMIGRRTAMMCAIGLFLTGTALCAIAPSMYFLIGARAIAGSGSGGLLTVTAIIISDLVSLADRGLYQGGVNVLFGAGAALGAVAGGLVGDTLGWRAAFSLQLPFIVCSFLLIVWKVHVPMPPSTRTPWEKFTRVDWAGTFSLITSVTTFMIAASLVTASRYPVEHPAVITLSIVSVLAIPAFIQAERKAVEPIMPLAILTRRSSALVLFAFLLLTATNFPRLLFQPIYLHAVRGLNGASTGALLLPASLVGSASSLYAGYYMRRYGEYKIFSIICSAIPAFQAFLVIYEWNLDTSVHRLWIEMALAALGGGAIITSLLTALIASVEPSQVGMAISACYLFRAIGQVVGVAVAGSIQQYILTRALGQRLAEESAELIGQIIQEPTTILPMLSAHIREQAALSYLESIDGVFWFAGGGGIVLTLCCVFMGAYPLPGR